MGQGSPTHIFERGKPSMTNRIAQPDEHLEKIAQEAVEEARMVLPGIQALFAFSSSPCSMKASTGSMQPTNTYTLPPSF
jgi:hypothetical protein